MAACRHAGAGLGGRSLGAAAGSYPAAADRQISQRPIFGPQFQVVPFKVSGELPVFPEAVLRLGDQSTTVRELEARLVQLKLMTPEYLNDDFGTATRAGVRDFQSSKDIPRLGYVDQYTWDLLRTSTRQPTRPEMYPPPPKPVSVGGAPLDPRCLSGRALCIDKSARQLVYVVNRVPVLRFDVRFGAVGTPTREGVFEIYYKSRYHVSKLYQSEMPYAMFFSGGQAVHYSSDFAARGYRGASHGCVNVRDKAKISWLYGQVQTGVKVVVYRS